MIDGVAAGRAPRPGRRGPDAGALLLDVVLGHGAHPDPAGGPGARHLAPPVGPRRPGHRLPGRHPGRSAGPRRRSTRWPGRRRCVHRPTPPRPGRPWRCWTVRDEPADEPPERVVTAGADLLADALPRAGHRDASGATGAAAAGDRGRVARRSDARPADARRPTARPRARCSPPRRRLVDVRPASEALGLERGDFPARRTADQWERASGPLRGALSAPCCSRACADSPEEAERLLAAGDVSRWEPCHHRGPSGRWPASSRRRCGCSSCTTRCTAATSWCSLNEGLGKVLRYGAYAPEVIERLRWMADVLGPALQTRRRGRAGRSTSSRSSPRWCRWATRATTATGPAR